MGGLQETEGISCKCWSYSALHCVIDKMAGLQGSKMADSWTAQ